MNYYKEYIKSREDWEFVGMYSDEGITATNTKHRDGFNQMVEDALAGKIDFIITKSVSRFARNTVDSLTTVRKLKEHGVEIYFEKENIWTLDAKGELLITIMSSLAQEESRSISENTTWGQRKRFADGRASVPYKNFLGYDKGFKVNLLQCRPLQTKGLGKTIKIPEIKDGKDCFFSSKGSFMGGSVRLPIDYVIFISGNEYLKLSEQGKYEVARQIGIINREMKGKNAMLVGSGRWGSTTPSLGVLVSFTELCNMKVICEYSSKREGFMPELSYGSHFFQDIVESEIFYVAIFDGYTDVFFNPERIIREENIIDSILPEGSRFKDTIHIAKTNGMQIYSDIVTQRLLCR